MEKGASPTIGFNISSSKNSDDDVVSLTKLHSAESFPSKITMMSFHHQENRRGRGRGGGGGPTGSNSGGANEVVGHMYHDGVSSSSLSGENFGTNSKPFDIFAASHKSPEGMMAANMVFPFTFAQWKELERQAMIYKYMISSVPVPPHLLYPLSRNFPDSSMYNVRYSKNGDPEPGRCKRTDGKKWRCSRDVAPHQKYCERHLHRGRPRSRKPVEVKNNGENNKKARVVTQSNLPNSSASQHFDAVNDKPLLLFNPTKSDLNISNAPSYKGTTRDLGLMMEGEMVAMDGAEQQWQHLIKANAGFTNGGSSIYGCNSLLNHDFVEQQPLNVLSYSNFPAPGIDAPTGFIDAWSINNLNSSNNGNVESSISTNHGNLSPSLTLSIAMAAGSILDQEMATIKCCDDQNTNESRWLNPVSWEPFAQGGPLAEALQPGSSACKNPASPHDSLSTAATTVSSPTGVLQRTLFSHSDGSVCNSPTFPAPPSEVAFQRLN